MNALRTTTLSLLCLLGACTWVNENPAGQSVAIIASHTSKQCDVVGNIAVRTTHKLGFIKRRDKKVLQELQTLARNEALKLGANTLVADALPTDGKQSYTAYQCPR
ncbi:MAG: DUF4156 domain-containing protein [Cellvibrionaceae bacterium]|nr:DUF4156 domain-containing protein [Cellvibrionaceae bacterium]